MKLIIKIWIGVLAVTVLGASSIAADTDLQQTVCPTAIFGFEERGSGVKGYGDKTSDILFAGLATNPNIYLVDRVDLKKITDEHELILSGIVRTDQAVSLGQLTGAKVLVTGSVIEADKSVYFVAKIISTETGRVLGESVIGKTSDEIAPLVEELASKVAGTIVNQTDKLIMPPVKHEDRISALNRKLGNAKRPLVFVQITERHIGQMSLDPAAETEMIRFLKEAGFEVMDSKEGNKNKAEIIIRGEGFSEFAGRRGDLISVKSRLEVKVIDPATDKIVAVDRQSNIVVDLSEQIAGKKALEEGSAAVADRILPKLVQ